MPSECFFYTDDMVVGYNGKPLIRQVNIRINRGEILTLVGPNGAGKSTILKSITRQLALVGGMVYLDGEDTAQMRAKDIAKKQAVVLTNRVRPEMMSVRDFVATGRYPYTGTLGLLGEEDKRIVEEALQTVHAEEIADRDFENISDGQRQRILLARAICQQPQIIILDEPTSFLDIRHKLEFLGILRRMVKENHVAVIMSLHELDLAQKISDKVMCVNGPLIERYGTPEEIFTEDYIAHLYGMSEGSYNANFGCTELPPSSGTAKTFVIAGGGSGMPVYRALQRAGQPFVTGILHENDIDFEGARHMANEVITEKAFSPITEDTLARARKVMEQCDRVICPLQCFGALNEANRVLREKAAEKGLLV